MEYNDELYHYGRLGMKWGQHIYASDGNLNKRGKRKFNKVANNKKLSNKHTEQAKKIISTYSRYEKRNAEEFKAEANMRGTSAESKRLYLRWAKESLKQAKVYDKAIKDIDSGNLKAGRDFVVNNFKKKRIYNTNIKFKDANKNYAPYIGIFWDESDI